VSEKFYLSLISDTSLYRQSAALVLTESSVGSLSGQTVTKLCHISAVTLIIIWVRNLGVPLPKTRRPKNIKSSVNFATNGCDGFCLSVCPSVCDGGEPKTFLYI